MKETQKKGKVRRLKELMKYSGKMHVKFQPEGHSTF